MATTIQVADDLILAKYIDIGGKRCEIESFSFSRAITEKACLESLYQVMSDEMIDRGIIFKKDGQYFWSEDGLPLIGDEDYED